MSTVQPPSTDTTSPAAAPQALPSARLRPQALDALAAAAGALPLRDWGVIRAQGEDAVAFLHGQLTQDVALMRPTEGRLTGYCSAKGRLLASAVMLKPAADEVLLLCPIDTLPATLRRLQMFVLRSRVRLTDASADLAVHGLVGPAVDAVSPGLVAAKPWAAQALPAAADGPWAGQAVRLPDAEGLPRALACLPAGAPMPGLAALPTLPVETWAWLWVCAGVAMVSTPLVDAFVPQMLNYESVGGVSFKKGCYPGQEVVARSQFRGTLKRRAFRAWSPQALPVGAEVFHTHDAEQPAGTVVAAAPHPLGGCDLLVSMQTSAAEAGGLTALSPHGPPLSLLPLPYRLLDDI